MPGPTSSDVGAGQVHLGQSLHLGNGNNNGACITVWVREDMASAQKTAWLLVLRARSPLLSLSAIAMSSFVKPALILPEGGC